MKQTVELVASHDPVRIEGLQHQKQFVSTYHRGFVAYFPHGIHYKCLIELPFLQFICAMLVESIPASSKQLGYCPHICMGMAAAQV